MTSISLRPSTSTMAARRSIVGERQPGADLLGVASSDTWLKLHLPSGAKASPTSSGRSLSLASLGYIWTCALTRRRDARLWASVAFLSLEGVGLVVGRGTVPSAAADSAGPGHPAVQLVLPPRAAKAAMPRPGRSDPRRRRSRPRVRSRHAVVVAWWRSTSAASRHPPRAPHGRIGVRTTALGCGRADVLRDAPPLRPPMGSLAADGGTVQTARARSLHGWARGRGFRRPGVGRLPTRNAWCSPWRPSQKTLSAPRWRASVERKLISAFTIERRTIRLGGARRRRLRASRSRGWLACGCERLAPSASRLTTCCTCQPRRRQ